jgi:outer membrane lipoprotein-sorting protein
MTNESQQPPTELLDQAATALRMSQVSPGPSRQLVEQTIESLLHPPEPVRLSFRRTIMFQLARHSKLAAALVLLAVGSGIFWMIDRSAGPAFAQVLENVKKATSVTFTVARKENPPERRDPAESETKWYLLDGFERIETADKKNVAITDYKQKLNFKLESEKKKVRVRDITDAQAAISPMDDLRKMAESDAELVETTELDGRKVRLYRLKQVVFPRFAMGPGNKNKSVDARVWVDVQTNLPVRITFDAIGRTQQVSVVLEKFTWNEQLDPKLFDLDVPEGFKLFKVGRHGEVEIKPQEPDDAK